MSIKVLDEEADLALHRFNTKTLHPILSPLNLELTTFVSHGAR